MITAADLPDGSIVSYGANVLTKTDEDDYFMWRSVDGYAYSNQQVDEGLLNHGETVVRHGKGE